MRILFSLPFLFILISLSGCSPMDAERKPVAAGFNANKKIVCHRDVGGSRHYIPGDGTILDTNTGILIDNGRAVVDKNLSKQPYDLFHCEVVEEKVTFYINRQPYLMINGVISKVGW